MNLISRLVFLVLIAFGISTPLFAQNAEQTALRTLFATDDALFSDSEKADLLTKAEFGENPGLRTAFAAAILDGSGAIIPALARFTAATRAATVPSQANQIGLQTSNNTLWVSTAATAGSWSSLEGLRSGNATLVAGTVTVANTTVTANTAILHSVKTSGGTAGTIGYTVTSGTSFTLTSSSATETSVVTYHLIELNP
jgi:hypothetical protein